MVKKVRYALTNDIHIAVVFTDLKTCAGQGWKKDLYRSKTDSTTS